MAFSERRDMEIPAQAHHVIKKTGLGTLRVFLATALWASSGIFISLILEQGDVPILALAFYRDIGSFLALLLGLGLLRPQWLRVQREDLRWMLAVGACIGGFHVLWNLSVRQNGVAVATVQQAVSPILVTLLAWLIWREALTWRKMAAVLLSLVGTVLVSGLGALGMTQAAASGLATGLGAALLYAGFSLLGKKTAGNYQPLTVLTFGFGFASLFVSPTLLFSEQQWPLSQTSLIYLGCTILLPTILGFSVYLWALRDLEASVASILAMSEIPIAYLYAFIFLGERLSIGQVVGALMVVGGVILLALRSRTSR